MSNKIINSFIQDNTLAVNIIYLDAQIMWRKTLEGEVLFSPLTLYKGWKLQSPNQVAFFIIWSIAFTNIFILILMFPVWLIPLLTIMRPFHVCIIYALSPLCLLLLYNQASRAILLKIKAKKRTGRLVGIEQKEFRSYLRSIVSSLDK